jgi:hypothetical protein
MKVRVHYIDNTQGEQTAVKIGIEEWQQLKKYLSEASENNKETIDFIETPVKVDKIEAKPKKRSFSDFLMDL